MWQGYCKHIDNSDIIFRSSVMWDLYLDNIEPRYWTWYE